MLSTRCPSTSRIRSPTDSSARANWTPYVFRTDDYGETWTSIATDAIDGYCLVIDVQVSP